MTFTEIPSDKSNVAAECRSPWKVIVVGNPAFVRTECQTGRVKFDFRNQSPAGLGNTIPQLNSPPARSDRLCDHSAAVAISGSTI